MLEYFYHIMNGLSHVELFTRSYNLFTVHVPSCERWNLNDREVIIIHLLVNLC